MELSSLRLRSREWSEIQSDNEFGLAIEPRCVSIVPGVARCLPPSRLNRRRFLGCSAAASLALSQGNLAEAAAVDAEAAPVRLGVIGVGNRGTALLRGLLELPGTPIVAVCDFEPKHRQRGQGIVEKARGLETGSVTTIPAACSIGPTSTRSSSPFRATCTKPSIATRSPPESTSTRKSPWP